MQWPRKSYAQMGEDLIIENNLNHHGLKGSTLTYLDIGTNHPCDSSNTYLFYEQGARGVLVEPDKYYWDLIREKRPGDKLLKACVANYNKDSEDFYVMTARSLNTLKKNIAEEYMTHKHMGAQKIESVIKVPVLDIKRVLRENFDTWPNIISVDTEGMDFEILSGIDWKKCRAEIVCVETNSQRNDIIKLMRDNRYRILGDNCLNIIFGNK